VDLRDLGGDERAEVPDRRRTAGAEESLPGQLQQDPPIARLFRTFVSGRGGLAHLLPQLKPDEAADPDILAGLGDRFRDQRADRDVLVAERLLEQHDLGEPLLQLAFDDLGPNASGFFGQDLSEARSSAFFASRSSAGIDSTVA
jgi:hypothetical protein